MDGKTINRWTDGYGWIDRYIRELVESLCRDGAHDTPNFSNRTAQNSQTLQLQAILDTYTYSTSALVPTKTLTVRKKHSYSHLRKLAKLNFWIFLFIIVFLFFFFSWSGLPRKWHKYSWWFYTKRLPSVGCVILDQENLCNFTLNCIIKNFHILLEAIFCMFTCVHIL